MRLGAVALALVLAGAVLARRALDTVEVRGGSMAPALQPGDRLLVVASRRPPRVGEIVVAADPRGDGRELVKRVGGIDSQRVLLAADGPVGRSAVVAVADVRSRVVLRYWPVRRAGRIGPAAGLSVTSEGGEPACAVPEALLAGTATGAAISPARSRPAGSRTPIG
jgi:hypothetical protein